MPPRPRRGLRLFRAALAAAALALPLAVGGFARQAVAGGDGARLLAEVIERVERFAMDSLSAAELDEMAARGLVDRLGDPYAELFSPDELAKFTREEIGNAYAGLGVQLEDQNGRATVTQVYPRTPAAEAGVEVGDRIVRVDTAAAAGRPLEEVSALLLGQPGTPVTVTLERAGVLAPITARATRALVHVPAVPYAVVLDGGVGYVPLQRFNETAAAEVAASLVRLQREGARAFVLDVRGNTGGDMEQSLAVSDLFLPQGLELATLRGRGGLRERHVARRPALVPHAPLVVLTDDATASASEIVAGALQDHDRALVVGTPSYGKGLVQSLLPLDGGWALKLTTARWYTPSGRSIQRERLADGSPAPLADAERPVFRSDAGRRVLGGGGITPDVAARPDTLSDAEQAFLRQLAPRAGASNAALLDLARELRPSLAPDFRVSAAWREDYRRRLADAGVAVRPEAVEAAAGLVDQLIEQRVASLAFGDAAAFRRWATRDVPLQQALRLLRHAPTQTALMALADSGAERAS